MARPVIITCAVTGSAPTTKQSPHVPITPEQIAGECIAAARAGAAVVHIHVRDPQTGNASMETAYYREVVRRIREDRTDVLINLTSGAGGSFTPSPEDPKRATPGSTISQPERRVEHILELKPDLCSLDIATMNFGEYSFINIPEHLRKMAAMINAAGVKPELEVFDLGMADYALTPRLTVVGGVAVVRQLESRILPVGGLVWTPNDQTRLELVVPRMRVARQLGGAVCDDLWVYLAGQFGGGSWAITLDDGSSTLLTYSDLRVSVGAEWYTTTRLSGVAEVGYVFARDISAFDVSQFTPDDTWMIRLGITF